MNQALTQTARRDYSVFRSWCLGNRCDNHAVKGYVKSIDENGNVDWYTTEEQINLDINQLESWQIIRYTKEELDDLNIMPEDCTYESEQDGTCGYGLFHISHNELLTIQPRI